MVQAPENIQSLNRYSYAMNNPLNATDPSGYVWVTLVVMALKAIAASAAVSSAVATAIGYVLTAYKLYGYYQMARGVLAAAKGNSAAIGKFVGGVVKSYAQSMAITMSLNSATGINAAQDYKAWKNQGQSEVDLKLPGSSKVRKRNASGGHAKRFGIGGKERYNAQELAEFNAARVQVQTEVDALTSSNIDELIEGFGEIIDPLVEVYNSELGANIFKSRKEFSIGKLKTIYNSEQTVLSDVVDAVADVHSHGDYYA